MEPFNVRDALLCLAFLAGAGVGVFAIVRKQTRAGGLAAAGFALLAVDPLAEFIIFRVLVPEAGQFDVANWTYVCIGAPAAILGVAALSAAILLAVRPPAPA